MSEAVNFIAFEFHDNDFHNPLKQAINFLVHGWWGHLDDSELKEKTVQAMYAYDMLRDIYNNRGVSDHRVYMNQTLSVHKIRSIDCLSNFEGYLYDINLRKTFYYSTD